MLVLYTNDGTRFVLEELGNTGLLQNRNTLRIANSEVLKAFQLSVGDDLTNWRSLERKASGRSQTYHSWELSISAVSTGLTVATESRDLREIEGKFALQPINGIARTPSQDADEIVSGKLTGLIRVSAHGITKGTKSIRISWCPRRRSWPSRECSIPSVSLYQHR